LVSKSKDQPESRSKNALLAGKDKIYLIGGLKGNNTASIHNDYHIPTTEPEPVYAEESAATSAKANKGAMR
jgi:hypothetical protein